MSEPSASLNRNADCPTPSIVEPAQQLPKRKEIELHQNPALHLNRADVIAAIDYHIKHIQDENKRPGWSAWALLGAIGTLAWIAFGEYSRRPNLETVGQVFLFGSLVADSLTSLAQYLAALDQPQRTQLRHRFTTEDPTFTSSYLLFAVFRMAIVLLVYLNLESTFSIPSLVVYCGLSITFFTICLLFRFVKILVLPARLNSRNGHVASAIAIFWPGLLAAISFGKISFSSVQEDAGALRLAFLCVAIVFLVATFVGGTKQNLILSRLQDIRGELAFGRISHEAALESADLSIFGLPPSAVVAYELNRVLTKLKPLVVAYEKLKHDFEKAEQLLTRLEDEKSAVDNKWVSEAREVALIIDTCENNEATNRLAFNDAFFSTKAALRAIERSGAKSKTSESKASWEAVRAEMDKSFEHYNSGASRLSLLKQRYLALRGGKGQSQLAAEGYDINSA